MRAATDRRDTDTEGIPKGYRRDTEEVELDICISKR